MRTVYLAEGAKGTTLIAALALAVLALVAGILFTAVMLNGIKASGRYARYVQTLPFRR